MQAVANQNDGMGRQRSDADSPRSRGQSVWSRAAHALAGAVAGGWAGTQARRRHMQILETLPLGAKKQLLLVGCDGERFLVGTGAEGVQTIVRLGRIAAEETTVGMGECE